MPNISIRYEHLSFEELGSLDQELVQEAFKAMDLARAPYSKFKVGSAVKLIDGQVVRGNNQENAAYPSGLCAERVALFSAKSGNAAAIDSIAIVAQNNQGLSANAFSCGSCRQVMLEYAGDQDRPYRVIMRDQKEKYIVLEDARLLLPFTFNAQSLE